MSEFVRVGTQAFGVVYEADVDGNVTVPDGIVCVLASREGSDATLYSDEGVTPLAAPFQTDELGTLPGYVRKGKLWLTVGARPAVKVEAVSGGDGVQLQGRAASFALTLADAGSHIEASHAAVEIVCTVPANADEDFPSGANVEMTRMGAAEVLIAPADGVTIVHESAVVVFPGTLAVAARYASVALMHTLTVDQWLCVGRIA